MLFTYNSEYNYHNQFLIHFIYTLMLQFIFNPNIAVAIRNTQHSFYLHCHYYKKINTLDFIFTFILFL